MSSRSNRLLMSESYILHDGTLPDTHMHTHAAIILMVSRGRPLLIETQAGSRYACHSVLINAGVTHRLLSGHEALSAWYIDITTPFAAYLRQHYFQSGPILPDLLALSTRTILHQRAPDFARFLGCFAGFHAADYAIDARLQASVLLMRQWQRMPEVAAACCLSPSRFSHLFSEQLGVAFRQYRLWQQACVFLRHFQAQHSLTHQALEHGFSDASHLSHSFRKLVGLSPSEVVGNYKCVEWLAL